MGYEPNPMAAGLAEYKRLSGVKPVHSALAWLNSWPDPKRLRQYHDFDAYWQNACHAAERFGYRVEEFVIDSQLTPARLQDILLTRNIRGILIPPGPVTSDWSRFEWSHFAAVKFGRAAEPFPAFPMVTSAQATNAALAFRKMTERGYRRIGYFGYATRIWTFLGGFLQELALSNTATDTVPPMLLEPTLNAQVLSNKTEIAKAVARFRQWLEAHRPDAILTDTNDLELILKAASVQIPRGIPVASLNVTSTSFDSGIYQNPEEIGRVAALMLISLLNENARGVPAIHREILIQGSWVDGKSLPPR